MRSTASTSISNFHRVVLAIAFIVYLVTAINSKGYFHFDEHYQIIEFACLKMGINNPSDLAWEYEAQIRPAIQPAVAVAIFSTLHGFGVTDVYILAVSLRILTGLLALTAISLFVRSSLSLVEPKAERFYILLSYLLWFLPFINVRFSSESWSGIFLILSVAFLQRNTSGRKLIFALAGLFLGISFLCRFQSTFFIIGLLCWYIIVGKESKVNIGVIASGCCVALLAGFAIDRWFYGAWVFTAWNYFDVNILKGVSSAYGIAPWNYYIGTIFGMPTVPIGCMLLVMLCILIYRKPRLLLLWIILPFLILHSVIPHKEDRFIFPMVNFIPLLITLGWQEITVGNRSTSLYRVYKLTVWIFAGMLVIINVGGLIVMASSPAGNGTKEITQYIHQNYKNEQVNLIYAPVINPYNPLYLLPLKEKFYEDKNIREVSIQDMDGTIINKDQTNLFVFPKHFGDAPDFEAIINKYSLTPRKQSIPEWIEWTNRYFKYFDDKNVIILYGNK